MRQLQGVQQISVALEEVGIRLEEIPDGLLGNGVFDEFGLGSCTHKSIVPSLISSASPVSHTGSLAAAPAYHELSPGQPYGNFLVQQSRASPGRDGSAGAGAAGERLAHAALVDAQIDHRAVTDLHEADVGAGRESLMTLDQRTEPADVGRCDIVDVQDAMRISHRHAGDLEPLAADIQIVVIRRRIRLEGNPRRFEFRRAHVDGDTTIVETLGFDGSRRAFKQEVPLVVRLAGEHAHDAANAVTALLHFRAVGVEDPVARIHRRVARRADPHQLVETGSGCSVAELTQLLGRRRRPVPGALVDDDYAIAGALHFQESELHGLSLTVSTMVIPGLGNA